VNWDAIGAIGEVVGAVGVIATLGYLAVQIRQNNVHLAENAKISRLGALESNAKSANQFRELLLTNPDLSELYARGCESYSALDSAERPRFGMVLRNMFQTSQIAHARYLAFRHDPDGYAGAERYIESLLRRKGIREWLDDVETDWRPEFRALVQSITERIDSDEDA
jgi:hypothetical protein